MQGLYDVRYGQEGWMSTCTFAVADLRICEQGGVRGDQNPARGSGGAL